MRALLLLLCFPLVASAEDPPHIAAAKRREAKTIEAKVTMTNGTLVREVELVLAAPKYRGEVRTPKSSDRNITYFDGAKNVEIRHSAINAVGHIFDSLSPFWAEELLGLIWVYRPEDYKSLRIRDWKATEDSEVIGGAKCQIFDTPQKKEMRRLRVWLDVANDYRICKVEFQNEKGDVSHDMVIEYGDNGRVSGWVRREFGVLNVMTQTCRVESLEIGRPIPEREFEVKYPPGAKIQEYQGAKTLDWIAAEDGTLLEAPKTSPPPDSPDWQRPVFSALKNIGAFALVLVVAIGGAIAIRTAIRKRRHKQAGNSNPE